MRFAGIIKNDLAAGTGVCVSVYVQGCPHKCFNCHNPETWNFDGGKEFTNDTLNDIVDSLSANGIQRNLCILGGEPLCKENQFLTSLIIKTVRDRYPDVSIYVWTGYLYEDLLLDDSNELNIILNKSDYLIDGPYIEERRDVTLKFRGSSNQRVIDLHTGEEVKC